MRGLREKTLPDHTVAFHQLSQKTMNKQTRLRSETIEFQIPQTHFQETQTLIECRKATNGSHRRSSSQQDKMFQSQDFEKTLINNQLTLDFTEHSKNHQLPEIKSFQKTQKLLVSPSLYQQFKDTNKVNGHFHSILSEMEHAYDAKKTKINVNKHSKVTVRQNHSLPGKRFGQSISENQISAILSKNRRNGFSLASQITEKLINKIQSLSGVKKTENTKRSDRWNLKDFYDPIMQQLQSDQINLKRQRDRVNILAKLKRINAECSDMEYNTQAAQSIQIFAKYSKNMSEKLMKKQRKIDKIHFYSY